MTLKYEKKLEQLGLMEVTIKGKTQVVRIPSIGTITKPKRKKPIGPFGF